MVKALNMFLAIPGKVGNFTSKHFSSRLIVLQNHRRNDGYVTQIISILTFQTRRKGSGVFAGKQGFMTLRDLFRWAERYRQASQGQEGFYDWDQHIADDGKI